MPTELRLACSWGIVTSLRTLTAVKPHVASELQYGITQCYRMCRHVWHMFCGHIIGAARCAAEKFPSFDSSPGRPSLSVMFHKLEDLSHGPAHEIEQQDKQPANLAQSQLVLAEATDDVSNLEHRGPKASSWSEVQGPDTIAHKAVCAWDP